MSISLMTGAVFKPKPSRSESRADVTDHAARTIIAAETERRDAKTAKLRQARLEREARELATAAPAAAHRSTSRKG